jgi:hypothetical protein
VNTCFFLAFLAVQVFFPSFPAEAAQNVPFSPQAPLGGWSDLRQEEGCEETSVLMAMAWAKGFRFTSEEARREIISISEFEKKTYGSYNETSAEDTVKRIFNAYFKYYKVEMKSGIKTEDIIRELEKGKIVIVPVNGRKLNNPYFTPPGPTDHMLVIKGYDGTNQEFITNDPGTRRGESYRYSRPVMESALRDYPYTGSGLKNPGVIKSMIVVSKS